MHRLRFNFDPVSPYACLAFEALPQMLVGCSYEVEYRPLLFAALLRHWGQQGPAEIAPKREWTFRQVAWTAQRQGSVLQTPAQHPFNPLALLRLALACAAAGGLPNRRVVEAIFHHVWRGGGADANDPARLRALTTDLAPQRDPAGAEVQAELRAHGDAAIAAGVFGVPTIEVGGRLFWGLYGLQMLAACLNGDPWFAGPGWDDAALPRANAGRRPGGALRQQPAGPARRRRSRSAPGRG